MFFEKVLSFKGAWNILNKEYSNELSEIRETLPEFITEYFQQKKVGEEKRLTTRQIWEGILRNKNWTPIDRRIISDSGKRIKIDSLGPVKNGICASIPLSHLEFFNRWFFLHSIIATKYRIVNIPILLIPGSRYTRLCEDRWINRTTFETIQNQLVELSPLSHPCPFLIIGYTEQSNINGPEIIELESDPLVNNNVRIFEWEKDIPPIYHQAVLEILNFFGTYLKDQYPNENADVTIKQMGAKIRLLVETKGDRIAIIEQAFGEYTSLIGKERPYDNFTNNEDLIIKLQTQMDFVYLQIELYKRLYNKLEKDSERKDKTIDKLYQLLISRNQLPSSINITNTNVVNTSYNFEFEEIIDNINELKQFIARSSEDYSKLKDLETAFEAIKDQKDKEVIKKAPAFSKLRKIIQSALDENSKFGKSIKNLNTAIELIKKLIEQYNKFANLLDLPSIPF